MMNVLQRFKTPRTPILPSGNTSMRFIPRLLWFMAYHATIVLAAVGALNKPDQLGGHLWIFAGFIIGIVIVLQASGRFPAWFHGLSLFVLLPGFLFCSAYCVSPLYQQSIMRPQTVRVQSVHSFTVAELLPGIGFDRYFSYTDAEIRLADGSITHGLIRPRDDHLHTGDTITMQVDPIGLAHPQRNVPQPTSAGVILLALLLGILAEIELASMLMRSPGSSFISLTAVNSGDKN